ncbi:MAG: hypothetical protein RLZZ604_1288, partial [Pseudomonadota bacterium]
MKLAADVETILTHLGTQISGDMASYSPVDGSNIGSVPTASASDIDAADALAEADIYIAYGRHQQAIDLLNNAISLEPGNPVYRLKLLEIYT